MLRDFGDRLTASLQNVSLLVDAERWDIHLFGVTRMDGEYFLHLAVIGPHTHALTIEAGRDRRCRATADRVVQRIREWLMTPNPDEHPFVELAARPPRRPSCSRKDRETHVPRP